MDTRQAFADMKFKMLLLAGVFVGAQSIGPSAASDIRENALKDNGRDMDLSNPNVLWMNRFNQGQQNLTAGQFARAAEAFRLAASGRFEHPREGAWDSDGGLR